MARVVLTQPWPRVRGVEQRLRALGHEPLAVPLSRIVELADDPRVVGVAARLAQFDWVVLVSPAAVAAAARMAAGRWPAATGIAVVGPGSLQAIADSAMAVDPARVLRPAGPTFDADALVDTPPLRAPKGLRILVLRGEGGSEGWIERLRTAGARVETCEVYRREPLEPSDAMLAALRALLERGPAPVFVFTQREAWTGSKPCSSARRWPDARTRRRRWRSTRASPPRCGRAGGSTCGRSSPAIGPSRPR